MSKVYTKNECTIYLTNPLDTYYCKNEPINFTHKRDLSIFIDLMTSSEYCALKCILNLICLDLKFSNNTEFSSTQFYKIPVRAVRPSFIFVPVSAESYILGLLDSLFFLKRNTNNVYE